MITVVSFIHKKRKIPINTPLLWQFEDNKTTKFKQLNASYNRNYAQKLLQNSPKTVFMNIFYTNICYILPNYAYLCIGYILKATQILTLVN